MFADASSSHQFVEAIAIEVEEEPLAYLPLEAAQRELVRAGLYTEDGLPEPEELIEILRDIEARIDEWVGHRVAVTSYVENSKTNARGIAALNHYPVVSVDEIVMYPNHYVGIDPVPIETAQISSIWLQDSRLYLEYDRISIRVRYRAGMQPIPRIFRSVTLAILKQAIARGTGGIVGADLQFLDETYEKQNIKSISLPGGLSKSYETVRLGDPKDGGGTGAGGSVTELDRLLAPLARYRRPLIV